MRRNPLAVGAQSFGLRGVPCLLLLTLAAAVLAQGRPTISWMGGGHNIGVPSIALSPDNQTLVSASFDTTVKVFNVPDALMRFTLLGHSVAALSAAVSPDGGYAATGGFEGTAILWNLTTGAAVRTFSGHGGPVSGVAFSPDGTLLATACGDGLVRIWTVADGTLVRTLSGHTDWVYTAAFSPDGTLVASGGGDGTILIWEVASGSLVYSLDAHSGSVLDVSFSPDGTLLASCGTDDAVRLWQVSTGIEMDTFLTQTQIVYCVSFSPDGSLLASGAGDGTVWVRYVATGALCSMVVSDASILDVAFSGDGSTVYASQDDGMICAWSASTGALQKWLTRHWGSVSSVAVSSDSLFGLSAGEDGVVILYDMATGAENLRFAAHSYGITSAALSSDGTKAATASLDGTACIWSTADGSMLQDLGDHGSEVLSVAFSPDGGIAATGAADGAIRLWDVSDGSLVGTLTGHTGSVWGLAFSPDGAWLASGSADGTVRKWNLATGTQVWQSVAADSAVLCVAFSPDGSRIATGARSSASGTLKIWDASNGAPIAASAGTVHPMRALAYSPDGLVIVTGGNEDDTGLLQFWQASNAGLLQTFDEETGSCLGSAGVVAVAYAPNKETIVYGRYDGTVVAMDNPFWPVPTAVAVVNRSAQIAELVNLQAKLFVPLSGGAVFGKDLAFAVDGTDVGTGTTDMEGVASCPYRVPTSLGLGDHTIGASFAGDSAYAASSGSGTLTVTKAYTSIAVFDTAGILGDPVVLSAQLRRITDDAYLSGHLLEFAVEATPVGSGMTNDAGIASVDYVIPIGAGAGERVITVQFAGDTLHRECTAYGVLTAEKRPTTTTVAPASGQIGTLVALSATVDFRGVGVPGVQVDFFIDGTAIGSDVTDESGTADAGYLIEEAAGVGTREIRAEFPGTAIYKESSGMANLEVLRTTTFLYVPKLSRTVEAGAQAVLRAYLFRSTDRAGVVGRPIEFRVEGTLVDTQITDENGRATGYYNVPPETGSADLTVRCDFAGDTSYYPSSGTATLTVVVQKAQTVLWVLPRLSLRGAGTYLRGYLRRATDYAWLPNKTVDVWVDSTYLGSAITNSDGRASLFYRVPNDMPLGYHVIRMRFNGDASYHPSEGTADMLIL